MDKTQTAQIDLDFEKADGCCRCGRTQNDDDGSQVEWECQICDRLVCRHCTMTIPHSVPREYYEMTLCSPECWEKAGRPDE